MIFTHNGMAYFSSFIFVTQGNILAPHSDHHHQQNIFLLLKGSCYTHKKMRERMEFKIKGLTPGSRPRCPVRTFSSSHAAGLGTPYNSEYICGYYKFKIRPPRAVVKVNDCHSTPWRHMGGIQV